MTSTSQLRKSLVLFFVVFATGCATNVNFEISPGTITLEVGQSQSFTAAGASDRNLQWSVNGIPGGNASFGTISSSGSYTAPHIPPTPNTVVISAARKGQNPSVFAHASIVNPAPAIEQSASTIITSATDVQIILSGSGFTAQSTATASGTTLSLNLSSSSQVTVTIPASIASVPGSYSLTVSNPSPGGGPASTILTVFLAGAVSPTNHPQVARYSFTSPVDANVTIEFGTNTSYGLRTWARSAPVGGGQVDILVAGMRAFTTYHLRATVQLQDGTIHNDMDHTFTTGGLDPSLLPNITVTQSSTLTPNPGVQVLNLVGGDPKVRAVVTDLQGNVIWYYDGLNGFPFPIKLLPNGNLLLIEASSPLGGAILREIDLAGNTVRQITAGELNQRLIANGLPAVLASGNMHHDFTILPNGGIVVLTNFVVTRTDLAGFPGQSVDVLGDSLVEIDENLDPVWAWSSFDHLDINRHRVQTPAPPTLFDWTHGNAVVYDPADGNLLVSLRHQHWVLKIDYRDGLGTGNILWRFGIEGDFTLTNGGPPDWQYGQHFPFLLDNQQVIYRMAIFDNGNDRQLDAAGTICGSSSGIACFSRAVIYEIDEALATARVLWEEKLPFFSTFIGSIQAFPDGNVLYDAGTINGAPNAILREVTQEASPQTVWQMDVTGQFVYRGVRLPSLYPGVQW